jgi:hypothetical protein
MNVILAIIGGAYAIIRHDEPLPGSNIQGWRDDIRNQK